MRETLPSGAVNDIYGEFVGIGRNGQNSNKFWQGWVQQEDGGAKFYRRWGKIGEDGLFKKGRHLIEFYSSLTEALIAQTSVWEKKLDEGYNIVTKAGSRRVAKNSKVSKANDGTSKSTRSPMNDVTSKSPMIYEREFNL